MNSCMLRRDCTPYMPVLVASHRLFLSIAPRTAPCVLRRL